MRHLALLCLASCLQPSYEPNDPHRGDVTLLTSSDCSGELRRSSDRLELSEREGVVEARLLREGQIWAWGRSPKVATGQTVLRLRPVGSFSPPADQNGKCTQMTEERTGHAAVRIADGSVHLSGGEHNATTLVSTELYDPVLGTFSKAMGLSFVGGQPLPRARHTATLLPSGRVVLAGGERFTNGSTKAALATALVADFEQNGIGVVPPRARPPNQPRTRHTAVRAGSMILFAGGAATPLFSPVANLEVFDEQTAQVVGPVPTAKATIAAAWVDAVGAALLVEGSTLELWQPSPGGGKVLPEASTLNLNRTEAWAFETEDGAVVLGEGGTERVDLLNHRVSPGPAIDAHPTCAAALSKSRWFVVGPDGAVVVQWSGGQWTSQRFATPARLASRPTCTLLNDGTVLLAGGERADGSAVADAWVFVPPL